MPSVPAVRQTQPVQRAGIVSRMLSVFAKAAAPVTDLSGFIDRDRSWFPVIREPFTGAWQRNREINNNTVMAYNAVYSCVTLIASDISKMCLRLVEQNKTTGIWEEADAPAFSPVLRKPNRYQTRIKFIENWVVSKLARGNTVALKERDNRGVVVAMYILDWGRVKPLVAPDGSVYYQLSRDDLAGVGEQVVVPASEIIHDTMCPLFHPLCGVSPLIACGLAAMQGLSIQANATRFFENGAMPGGVLSAPGTIDDVTAARLKEHWEQNYTGSNAGRVAVLGDGLKYEKMAMTAVESQMIEQLKWTAETVCSCFHVPAYMVGVGTPPAYNNVEALNQQYYSQCLQAIIESIELLLDEGLGLTDVKGHIYGTEFDLDGLLRMDTATQYKTIGDGIGAALLAPNEGRKKIGLKPLPGGNSVFMQQQNYSLEALAKRDALEDPFALAPKAAQHLPSPADEAAAVANVDTPPPAKSFKGDDLDQAATVQIARWAFKDALELELQKMAA
ncbi:HK97 family phage portal protein [Bradyrhizobium sp. LA8.1]|uniref:phage portal protein n=1 Tax=unclassified Bradyrhizobium TaxID=2631580 RepID=UPI003391F364